MKLQHIGEFVINPANIAWIEELSQWGSRIYFNSYAAVSSAAGDTAWEMPHVEIEGVYPLQIMELINNEPSF